MKTVAEETTHIIVAAWGAFYMWIIRHPSNNFFEFDYVAKQYEKAYNAFEYENMN